jgi:hypothetical protein
MSAMRVHLLVVPALILTAVACGGGKGSVGFIHGTVTDAVSGEPVRGSGSVTARKGGRSGIDASGRYTIRVRAGVYEVVATAPTHMDGRRSERVLAGDTVIADFFLWPRRAADDSIIASFARMRIRELRGIANRRHPEHIAFNNSIRMAAWGTFQSGKGAYGMKMTATTVEDDPVYMYLLVEHGTCRRVYDGRMDKFGGREVHESKVTRFLLSQGRQLTADSTHYIAIPFSGPMPKDKELRFEFPDDSGYVDGRIGF